MTDREMLELAAKAAGYSIVWGEICITGDTEVDCTDIPYVRSNQQDESDWYWDPRTDDGDAFRLQVGLNMHTAIQFDGDTADAWVYDDDGPLHFCSEPFSAHAGDKCAAMRMAILRCAAAIGMMLP